MNKQGVGKIEWTDFSWSPVRGCLRACWYCYGQDLANRFDGGDYEPRFHPERLDQPRLVRKPSRIFVCPVADLFGSWIEDAVIDAVVNVARDCPQHTFLFLTKYPGRYKQFVFSANCWLGASVTGEETAAHLDEINAAMSHNAEVPVHFASAEPLLHFVPGSALTWADWIITGALSGPKAKEHVPQREWVWVLSEDCKERGIPFFTKRSITMLYPDLACQEWPETDDAYSAAIQRRDWESIEIMDEMAKKKKDAPQ